MSASDDVRWVKTQPGEKLDLCVGPTVEEMRCAALHAAAVLWAPVPDANVDKVIASAERFLTWITQGGTK